MVTFEDFYYLIETHGETIGLFVPFLLVTFIVHSALKNMNMFSKRASGVISVIMGISIVMPHVMGTYPECWDLVVIINQSLPTIGLTIVGLFVFFIILGFIGFGRNLSGFQGPVSLFFMGVVVWTFLSSGKDDLVCPRYDLGFLESAILLVFLFGIPWLLFKLFSGGRRRRGYPTMYP